MNLAVFLAKRLSGGAGRAWRTGGMMTAMSGIALAVTFVLTGLGILAGFQQAYRRAILDFNAHVIVSSADGLDTEEQEYIASYLDRLTLDIPLAYSPYVFFETLMPTRLGMKPVVLKGIDLTRRDAVYPFAFHPFTEAGQLAPVYAGEGVLSAQGGDVKTRRLKILSLIDDHGRPRTRLDALAVTGSFSSGLQHYDSQFVLMDIADLQRRYFHDRQVNGFEIRLQDPNATPTLAERMRSEIGAVYEITTWDELNRSLLQALLVERSTFFAVSGLILAIACLSLFGFNFLFFLARRQEFAVLSLLGTRRKTLRDVLSLMSIGIGGGATLSACFVAGVFLWLLANGNGIALDPDVYFVKKIPAVFAPVWFGAFLFLALVLCWLASRAAGWVIVARAAREKAVGNPVGS